MSDFFINIIFNPALIGAISAVIIFIITDSYKRNKDKRINYDKALFKIQMICNGNLDLISLNNSTIKNIIDLYTDAQNSNKIPLQFNIFYNIQFDDNILIYLLHKDYMNEYYSYGKKILRQNSDLSYSQRLLESLRQNYLDKNISKIDYLGIFKNEINKLKVIINFNNSLFELTKEILIKSRVLSKYNFTFYRKLITKIYSKRNKNYDNNFWKEYEKEKNKLEEELKITKQKSNNFISSAFNKN